MEVNIEPNMKTLGPKFGKNAAAARAAIEQLDGKIVEKALHQGSPIMIMVDEDESPIDKDDVNVVHSYRDGWAGASDGKTIVLLNTTLTPELKSEGIARDIIRNVQNLRKDAGLDIADRIKLSLVSTSDDMNGAVQQCRDYIASETLAVDIQNQPIDAPDSTTVKIDGQEMTVTLCKVV